jgi:hypothetical protein
VQIDPGATKFGCARLGCNINMCMGYCEIFGYQGVTCKRSPDMLLPVPKETCDIRDFLCIDQFNMDPFSPLLDVLLLASSFCDGDLLPLLFLLRLVTSSSTSGAPPLRCCPPAAHGCGGAPTTTPPLAVGPPPPPHNLLYTPELRYRPCSPNSNIDLGHRH